MSMRRIQLLKISVLKYYRKKDNGKIKCQIWGFFEDFYGEEFEDTIHVHSIKVFDEITEEYEVNPIKDLLPVCSNCHLSLHIKNGVYSIEGSRVEKYK